MKGRVLALETAWNHALENKDAKALDMLLASSMVSVDIDGSVSNKSDFLASIKAPDYQTERGRHRAKQCPCLWQCGGCGRHFSIKGAEKGKPYVRRERFVDTWVKFDGAWQCVATTSALITAKQ